MTKYKWVMSGTIEADTIEEAITKIKPADSTATIQINPAPTPKPKEGVNYL